MILVTTNDGRVAVLGDGDPIPALAGVELARAWSLEQDRRMRAGLCPNGCGPLHDSCTRPAPSPVTRSTKCGRCGFIGQHSADVPVLAVAEGDAP